MIGEQDYTNHERNPVLKQPLFIRMTQDFVGEILLGLCIITIQNGRLPDEEGWVFRTNGGLDIKKKPPIRAWAFRKET